jgi:hypothetical protein
MLEPLRIFVPSVILGPDRTAGPDAPQGNGFALSARRQYIAFTAFSGSTADSEIKPEIR